MKIKTYILLLLLTITPQFVHAGEIVVKKPIINEPQNFENADYQWTYTWHEGVYSLSIEDKNDRKTTYDLNCASICTEDTEEDNCHQEGFYELAYESPALGVACHFGAHSQKFMIFSPNDNSKEPVLEVTGSYYVNVDANKNGVKVTYDRDEKDQYTYWPSKEAYEREE